MRRPLYHLLYTNAPGAGGSGYRHVPVSFPEGGDPAPIQRWLETLQQVSPGASEGWAFHSFGMGRSLFPVLAVVNPSFSSEEHGRGRTVLVHAFVLALSEGEAVGAFERALYEKAKVFLDDSRHDREIHLDSYLAGCRAASGLNVQKSEPKELLHLEARFLRALFHASSQSVKNALLPGVLAVEDLPEQILWAGAALPPRLRLQLRWRVGLQPGTGGFVALPGEGEASDPTGNWAVFCDWLERALQEQRFETVYQLSENWEIRDWNRLAEVVRAPEDRPAVAAVAPPPGVSRASEVFAERKMGKKATKRPEAVRPAASQAGKSASDYGEEYQSLQRDLREYLDERFSTIQDYLEPRPMSGKAPWGPWARLKAWRPEIYFLILLLLWGFHYFSSMQAIRALDEPVSMPRPTSQLSTPADPLEEWGSFVNENKDVVAWFRALAERRGVDDRQVSPSVAAKFESWAHQLEQGRELTGQELQESVIGLFEYVHARWARDNGKGDPAEDVVTLNPQETQRNFPALVADLGLDDELGAHSEASDPEVQVHVVRAWLERHPQP